MRKCELKIDLRFHLTGNVKELIFKKRFHFSVVRVTIVRKTVAGKDVEKKESLFTADVATMEMSVEVLQESENNTTV